jgi:hypothetical protein
MTDLTGDTIMENVQYPGIQLRKEARDRQHHNNLVFGLIFAVVMIVVPMLFIKIVSFL